MMKSLNFAGRICCLERPWVMGILNVTPDSFYDGGKYELEYNALRQVEKMLEAGADIIDIGGMSSRPGAEVIDKESELARVIPMIKALVKEFPNIIISVDTVRGAVAQAAIEEGALMVNDISAGRLTSNMYPTVSDLNVPYVLMHMQGRPENMQVNPSYGNVRDTLMEFFVREIEKLNKSGIKDVILDVGFGFGKTLEQNYQLLNSMEAFKVFDYPILVGISRKSMIYKYLKIEAGGALNGTTALHMEALRSGADILRVHDVKEAAEAVRLHGMLYP